MSASMWGGSGMSHCPSRGPTCVFSLAILVSKAGPSKAWNMSIVPQLPPPADCARLYKKCGQAIPSTAQHKKTQIPQNRSKVAFKRTDHGTHCTFILHGSAMARSNPKLLYPQTAKKSAAKNSAAKNSAAKNSAAKNSAANKSAANKSVTNTSAANTSAANTSVAKKSVASRIAELQTQVAQGRDKIGKRTVKYNLKLCLMEQEVQRLMHKIENLRENTWP
jgi:hypothetical protein